MKLLILLFTILAFLAFPSHAQNQHTIDSLKQLLNTTIHDSVKLKILDQLIESEVDEKIWPKYNDQMMVIAERLLTSASKSKNIETLAKRYISSYLNNMGYLSDNHGNYEKALEYYNQCIKIKTEINDQQGLGITINNVAVICMNKGDHIKALEYFNQSLKLNNLLSNSPDKELAVSGRKGAARALNNLGYVYDHLGDLSKALEYYNKSLKEREKLNDTQGIGYNLNNIALIYFNQGDFAKAFEYYNKGLSFSEKAKDKKMMATIYGNLGLLNENTKKIDEALKYYNKSLIICEELGDKKEITTTLINMGTLYFKQKKIDVALKYYEKCLQISEDVKDKKMTSFCLTYISAVYLKQKQTGKALVSGKKAYELSKELGYPQNIERAATLLADIYETQGNFQKALQFYKEEILMRDSILNKENYKKIQKQQARYEYEKKAAQDSITHNKEMRIANLEIEKKNAETKKQRIIIAYSIGGLLLVIIFSLFLFRLFLQKKKANKIITEKKEALQIAYEEINTQKEEITVQRDSIQEQKELIEEHQKEIQDSINYAKRIQQAVMPDLTVIARITKQSVGYITNQIDSSSVRNDTQMDFFVLFKPKDIVSGDFYWSTRIGEMLIITVADCTGHGVPGAFMSMLGISFLNEIVRKKELTKASDVLDELRTSVIDALKQKGESGEQKDGMDIALCAINMNTFEMQFAGANNPVWIVNQFENLKMNQFGNVKTETGQFPNFQINAFPNLIGPVTELVEVKGDKMPIGIHSNMHPFTNQIYQLQQGDTIYLMSDGYEDQFGGPKRKKFLSKNLKNLLIENSQKPMTNQQQILETTITEWIGGSEQIDDITVLGIKI